MYEVYINGEKVKEYPFRIQAEMYLRMRGYASNGGKLGEFLKEGVEIRKKTNDEQEQDYH